MKFLYPRTLNYFWMLQRPQQILRALAAMGEECHFISSFNPIIHPKEYEVKEKIEIEPNLFLHPSETEIDDIEHDIIYYSNPMQQALVHSYDSLIIFDSVDEPDGPFATWNLGGLYDDAVRKADLIIATADNLKQRIEQLNRQAFLIPNGCDYEHFSKTKQHQTCNTFDELLHPKIVYCGAIASWLDWDLIVQTAKRYPYFNFIFIGFKFEVQLDLKNALSQPNIHILGGKDYCKLPSYLQNADVLIIPFDVNNPVTKSTNPIKLWEYFAVGKPVVTTAMRECEIKTNEKPYPLVYYSKNNEEFIKNIKKALFESKSDWRNGWNTCFKRKEIAKENSWEKRAKELKKLISDFKCGKKN